MKRRLLIALASRSALLDAAKERYGDALMPRHWMLMQLYPVLLLGLDVCGEAAALNTVPGPLAKRPLFTFIVLDETQLASRALHGFFWSADNE